MTPRDDFNAGPPTAGDDELLAIWAKNRPAMLERVSLIERAVAALLNGELDDQLRAGAQRAAHTLVGSAGTFGFQLASQTARELELALHAPTQVQIPSLSAQILALRHALEPEQATPPSDLSGDAITNQPTQVLLVNANPTFSARFAAQATAMGIQCDLAATPEQARASCLGRPPTIVLLDLDFPTAELADLYELLSELTAGASPTLVLILADSDAFADRVEAARRGGRAFLPKSLSPAELLDAAVQLLARERLQTTRVLLVDDDPAMLDAMRVLLERHGIQVSTLADPARFWETLEQVAPELLVLDVDMPGVNGPELCRVVRNDSRWSQIAVVFVTAHTDPETVEGVFRAGADDYLAKPIVGSELITRVANRLDRVRLQRLRAETDPLTGLCNRAKSSDGLAQLLSLAERFAQPMSIAMLDLDAFKTVNDTHGHAAGDSVLRALGECLRRDFRGDDVVGRWGGEEFIVGMYGMSREDGVRRLTDTLRHFGLQPFTPGERSFQVSFSAGVAEYPRDGHDLTAVTRAADEALYRAKTTGRARVLAATPRTRAGQVLEG